MDKEETNVFKHAEQSRPEHQDEAWQRITLMAKDTFLREILKDELLGTLGHLKATTEEELQDYFEIFTNASALLDVVVARLEVEYGLSHDDALSAVDCCRISISPDEITWA